MIKRAKLLVAAAVCAVGLWACGSAFPGTAPGIRNPFAGTVSNGEAIYLTGMTADGEVIPYTGGPTQPMMMNTRLACASCHGEDGRGGTHTMHMQRMDAPDIRPVAMEAEDHDETHGGHDDEGYTLEKFRQAVIEGRHPDGDALGSDMPRWQLSEEDLADLYEYIQNLP